MSARVDQVIAKLLKLHIRLLVCQARLSAETDPEALHDLRISVRRLRSLLRPLRGLPGVDTLEGAAAAVGQLTTSLRDKEVLAAHLAGQQQFEAAARRLAELAGIYRVLAVSAELSRLLAILDAFPGFLRAAQRQKLLWGLRQRIEKRLARQRQALTQALQDPAHDRHRLRLLVKRVRYAAEAYPGLDRLPSRVTQQLVSAQKTLGDWHDCLQWLAQAERQADLQPCITGWQRSLAGAEILSDQALDRLLETCQAK